MVTGKEKQFNTIVIKANARAQLFFLTKISNIARLMSRP